MRVAVLGTGIMGAGVAGSLLRSGHRVTVWNRDSAKAEPLREAGAVIASTPQAAVADAQAVLTVLYDADAVIEVMEQAAPAMLVGSVWAQLSTIGLDGTARAKALAERHGIAVVEAMMLGTKQPAEQGTLVLLVSGDPRMLAMLSPVFDAIGAKVVNAGEQSGRATALKLAANAWVQSLTAMVAQSLAMAAAFGLDPQKFLDAIAGGATDTPYAHVKGAAMLKGEYPTTFSVDGVLKDLGLIRAAAQQFGVPDGLLEHVENMYATAARNGHAGDDMAAVYTEHVENMYATAARNGHAGDDMAAVYTAFGAGSP